MKLANEMETFGHKGKIYTRPIQYTKGGESVAVIGTRHGTPEVEIVGTLDEINIFEGETYALVNIGGRSTIPRKIQDLAILTK